MLPLIIPGGLAAIITLFLFAVGLKLGPGLRKVRNVAFLVVLIGFAAQTILLAMGLSLRRCVITLLILLGALAFVSFLAEVLRGSPEAPAGKTRYAVSAVATAAAVGLCTFALVVGQLFTGEWWDTVEMIDGQKMVVEQYAFFHEVGYRYVNPLVHGEQIWEWQD